MGTTSEWLQALLLGGLWGGGMAWWSARDRAPAILRRKSRILHVVLYALAGLLFGIMSTFHLQRVVHTPLVFVTVAAVAGMLLVELALSQRKLRKVI